MDIFLATCFPKNTAMWLRKIDAPCVWFLEFVVLVDGSLVFRLIIIVPLSAEVDYASPVTVVQVV